MLSRESGLRPTCRAAKVALAVTGNSVGWLPFSPVFSSSYDGPTSYLYSQTSIQARSPPPPTRQPVSPDCRGLDQGTVRRGSRASSMLPTRDSLIVSLGLLDKLWVPAGWPGSGRTSLAAWAPLLVPLHTAGPTGTGQYMRLGVQQSTACSWMADLGLHSRSATPAGPNLAPFPSAWLLRC